MAEAERHRWRRVILLILGAIVLEAALVGLSRLAPAMAGLIRPLYAAVAAVLLYIIWHAARRRRGQDRRQSDRRTNLTPSDHDRRDLG